VEAAGHRSFNVIIVNRLLSVNRVCADLKLVSSVHLKSHTWRYQCRLSDVSAPSGRLLP
jgi:hypothetical protein